jgi:enamine deaminase RidA (YjgF/YER057c/UK114 family)
MEDDEILTQDIFAFEQTGIDEDGKVQGFLKPTGIRPTFMDVFEAQGVELPPDQFGIPADSPDLPKIPANRLKSRRGGNVSSSSGAISAAEVGKGRTVVAGGMVYVTSMGPLDEETGEVVAGSLTEHTRACLTNLKRRLEGVGSSLEKVVWASWALRDPGDFDTFSAEWMRWFPGDTPIGQLTLMPPLQRRAGFRVSIGVIAEA